ncbi:MAG: hypothetical protein ACTFAK_02905 [Candidatus Electronema sp. VV]
MKQYIEISCRHYGTNDPVKNGHSVKTELSGSTAISAERDFSMNIHITRGNLVVKEQIEKQTMNRCGVRDISRNLDISKDTAISKM